MTHICVGNLNIIVAWSAPSHYLNQCWDIVNWTLRNKLQWNCKQYSYIFIKKIIWKCRLRNWGPFCLGLNVLTILSNRSITVLLTGSNCIQAFFGTVIEFDWERCTNARSSKAVGWRHPNLRTLQWHKVFIGFMSRIQTGSPRPKRPAPLCFETTVNFATLVLYRALSVFFLAQV